MKYVMVVLGTMALASCAGLNGILGDANNPTVQAATALVIADSNTLNMAVQAKASTQVIAADAAKLADDQAALIADIKALSQ